MRFNIKVDKPLHGKEISPDDTILLDIDDDRRVTVGQLYLFLEGLGYNYPKYKLFLNGVELSRRMVIQDFLPQGGTLNLNDPILIPLLVGGTVGYLIGKS